MQQHQTEVLVVGAGPVGMLTTLVLARNGIRTQLIDQEARTAGHSYACAVHPHTLELLEQVGVAAEAVRIGHRVTTIGLYGGGTRHAELNLSELPTEFPFVLVLEQGRLEDLLEEAIRRTPNAEVAWHHRLAELSPDSGGVTATIERLARTAKGYIVPEFELAVEKRLTTRAEFVVGADGHNSLVRQLAGIKYEPAGERELFAVYELGPAGKIADEMSIVLERGTTNVMWPFADGRCRWSFQLVPVEAAGDFPDKDRSRFVIDQGRGEEERRQRLLRLLRERAPWFGTDIRDMGWGTDIQFEHSLANRFGQNRCWLAGDAAHQTGPVGMQSMNAGMREGAELALTLKKVLRETGSPELLEDYGELHRAEWQQLLGLNGGPEATNSASTWVKANCAAIPGCLPAFGGELAALLNQIGLVWKPDRVFEKAILEGL